MAAAAAVFDAACRQLEAINVLRYSVQYHLHQVQSTLITTYIMGLLALKTTILFVYNVLYRSDSKGCILPSIEVRYSEKVEVKKKNHLLHVVLDIIIV